MTHWRRPARVAVTVAVVGALMVAAAAVGAALTDDKEAEDGPRAGNLYSWWGTPRYVEVIQSDGESITSSTTFVDVPAMVIDHRNPVKGEERLLITVSGFTKCTDTDGAVSAWCEVRVLVDGYEAIPGGRTIFDSAAANGNDGNAQEAHTTQWTASTSGYGSHIVRLQFRVDEAGATFTMDNVTMSLQSFTGGTRVGDDGIRNEGLICFSAGQKSKSALIGGPKGYDITRKTVGFATLQGNGGSGVAVRYVELTKETDRIRVVLTKEAATDVCAAYRLEERS